MNVYSFTNFSPSWPFWVPSITREVPNKQRFQIPSAHPGNNGLGGVSNMLQSMKWIDLNFKWLLVSIQIWLRSTPITHHLGVIGSIKPQLVYQIYAVSPGDGLGLSYYWWKKSCTTWDVMKPCKYDWYLPYHFVHQQYHGLVWLLALRKHHWIETIQTEL